MHNETILLDNYRNVSVTMKFKVYSIKLDEMNLNKMLNLSIKHLGRLQFYECKRSLV